MSTTTIVLVVVLAVLVVAYVLRRNARMKNEDRD
jgi:hypothetical protein